MHSTLLLLLFIPYIHCQPLSLVHTSDDEQRDSPLNPQTQLNDSPGSVDEFVPTEEWQEIKAGQSIPKGLHVRVNMQTGLKEAKLMETQAQQVGGEDNSHHISATLEKALKNIASSHDEPSGNKETSTSSKHKQKFRSMEEIKRSFAKQNVTLTSEMELVTTLYQQLVRQPDTDILLELLDDLEFYVHNYDNGVYFADLGGVVLLTHLINTSTHAGTVAKAALTLGSAAQSNGHVTKAAKVSGTMPVLLKSLKVSAEDSTKSPHLLFAISSLVRTDTDLITDLILYDGASTFALVIDDERYSLKSKVKIYTLLDDLLVKTRNSTEVGVRNFLVQQSFGELLCRQLSNLLRLITGVDQSEKLLSFLVRSLDIKLCEKYADQLLPVLAELEDVYSQQLGDLDMTEVYQFLLELVRSAQTGLLKKDAASHAVDEL